MLCSVLSVLAEDRTYAALPVAVLAALAYLLERLEVAQRHPLRSLLLEALAAGACVMPTGGADSPMLPYLLAPGLAAGLAATRGQVLLVCSTSAAGMVTAGALSTLLGRDLGPVRDLVVTASEWVVLSLGLGLLAHWAQGSADLRAPASPEERYSEVRGVLSELRALTRRLPGGLDAGSAAQALLDTCAAVAPSQRSAVLVQTGGGALVPAAVRGTARVPWRTPLSEPGPLQQAWNSGEPVVDRRPLDDHGRRRGSSLAVLPLRTSATPFGLLILEAFDEHCFPPDVVEELEESALAGAARLETALLFEEVRSTVSVEERDRLAREMHDGVAQELAYVGYQLDDLRGQAAKVDEGLAAQMTEVRTGLTRLISDIRLSITDLRTSVSSDRGLGSAISHYVRAVGSGQKLAVHLSLQESPFRLPSEQEVLLFQIAQAVAQDVRKHGEADNLWVALTVDPPSARLRVEHDGTVDDPGSLDLSEYAETLTRLGGSLRTEARPGSGLCVHVALEGDDSGDTRTSRRRPRPDPAGSEARAGGD